MSTTRIPTATSSTSIADILERVLDMGVVIAGDIRIKLVDIERKTRAKSKPKKHVERC